MLEIEKLPMLDVMLDIETLDNSTTSTITAIGAVLFNVKTGDILDRFYRVVDLQTSINAGLTIKAETLSWWLGENPTLLKELLDDPDKVNITQALFEFGQWLENHQPKRLRIWGNSNRFDLGILQNAHERINRKVPWKYNLERDLRTFMDLPNLISEVIYDGDSWINENDFKKEEIEKATLEGKRHHPIVDAEVQIRYLIKTLKHLTNIYLKDQVI